MKISALPVAIFSFLIVGLCTRALAQVRPDTGRMGPVLLVPDAVWDGVSDTPHPGWVVLVGGDTIEAVGPLEAVTVPQAASRIELTGTTLIPGLIEGHSHLFLHSYDE